MKRFLAFAGDNYYPGGGMDDFTGDYDTLEEAIASFAEEETSEHPWLYKWGHIYDSETRATAWQNKYYGT